MSIGLMDGVRKRVLENGLTVLVNEDRSTGVVALEIFVRVGSNNESDAVWGWSHGIEHLLFKGTEKRGVGKIAREVASLGGVLNAGTGYEATSYQIVVPAAGFEQALDIHADVLQRSAFRQEDLDRERGVLVEELNMYRDVPDGFGFTLDELMRVAFERHRYSRGVIGSVERLRNATRDEILDYFHRGYVPSNIIYVVAGDVDADEALERVTEALGSMPARPSRLPEPEVEPEQAGFRHVALTGDIEKCYFKIAFHVPDERHADTPALRVVAHLLGSGRSSRFHRRLVEEAGLVSQIGTMEIAGMDPGVLVVDAATEPETLEAAISAVFVEIERFHTEPASNADLDKALNNVITEFVTALETVEGQASVIGSFELLGDHRLADAYVSQIAEVSAEDVRRVAARYLRFDASTVLTYTPGEASGPNRVAEPELAANLRGRIDDARPALRAPAATQSRPARAPARTASSVPDAGENAVEERTLPGDARLLVRRRSKLPTVVLAVYGRAGLRFERAERLGTGVLAVRSLMKGTRSRSDEELAEEIERHAITIQPIGDRDSVGFYVEALTSELGRALDLFAELLLEPAFAVEAVERERELMIADIAKERDDTVSVTVDAFNESLFRDHPYGWNPLGTEESVRAIEREDLVAWHRRFFVLGNLSFAVVGDVDPSALERELAARIASLPLDPAPPVPPLELVLPDRLERRNIVRDKAQSVIVLGFHAPTMHADSRFAHLVLNALLGEMGGRLFTELRDRRHLCYFVQTFFRPFEDAGAFGALVGTGPDRVDEAVGALAAELDRARSEPPSREELDRHVASLIGKRLISLQRNGHQAASFARAEALGLGWEQVMRLPERLAAVTCEDVQEAARTTLTLDRGVLATLTTRATTPEDGGAR